MSKADEWIKFLASSLFEKICDDDGVLKDCSNCIHKPIETCPNTTPCCDHLDRPCFKKKNVEEKE